LGDIHIDRGEGEDAAFDNIVANILNNHSDTDVILHTGDLVEDGRKSQYRMAKRKLQPLLDSPILFWGVPGNHDYGWKGNYAQSKRFKYFKSTIFGDETVSYPHVKRDGGGNVYIGLNSMKSETGFGDGLLADGELGHRQIESLSSILDGLEDRPANQKVLVYLHHHPFHFPDEGAVRKLFEKAAHWLKDGNSLMNVIAGRVDVLLFGHEHRHLDFSQSDLKTKYRIPKILSGGKCTENAQEFELDQEGCQTEVVKTEGYLARQLLIDGESIEVSTINLG